MSRNLIGNVKIGYKRKLMFVLLAFGTAVILLLFGFAWRNYKERMLTKATENTNMTLNHVRDELYNELRRISDFYLACCHDDRVTVAISKELTESDYSDIHGAYTILGGNNMMNDYIAEFTMVNFSSMKVLSSKGFYNFDEMTNAGELTEVYNSYDELGRSFWYLPSSGTASDLMSVAYRTTVQTKGVNLVIILPLNSIDVRGMLVVRINENKLYEAACGYPGNDLAVAIFDEEGGLLYCTDNDFSYACRTMQDMNAEKVDTIYGNSYVVSSCVDSIIGRRIFVGTNLESMTLGENVISYFWVVAIGAFIVLFLVALFKLAYHPLSQLAHMVSSDGDNENSDALETVVNHIEEINSQKEILEEEINNQKLDMLELYERKLINGEMSPTELEESMNTHDVFIKPYYYTMSVILKGKDDEDFAERRHEKNILVSTCMEIENEFLTQMLWQPIYLRGALWIVFEDDEIEALNHIVPEFFDKLCTIVYDRYGMKIKAGVSSVRSSVSEFSETVQESIRALNRDETNDAVNESDINNINFYTEYVRRGESVYDRAFEKETCSAILGGNKEQLYNSCDVFFDYLRNPQFSRSEIMAYLFQYVSSITLAFMEMGLDSDDMYRISTNEIYTRLLELYDLDKIRKFIKWNLIDSAWEKMESKQEGQSGSVLAGIDRLVEEKKGNITLTECADILGVHPTYIWKLLRKERGKSFSEYRESYRLNEAKRLLIETDMSVADIAAELHYTNAQNFIRFFSKETEMTPGKFRKAGK